MHPDLRPKVVRVLEALTQRGFQPKVFFAWRSVAVQLEIFKKGNTENSKLKQVKKESGL